MYFVLAFLVFHNCGIECNILFVICICGILLRNIVFAYYQCLNMMLTVQCSTGPLTVVHNAVRGITCAYSTIKLYTIFNHRSQLDTGRISGDNFGLRRAIFAMPISSQLSGIKVSVLYNTSF